MATDMKSRSIASRTDGFTLIELLVVVSIIAVLIAMLLPALDRARGEAQSVVCLSLQKNFGLALILYKDDNNDAFPLFASSFPSSSPGSSWNQTIMAYIDEDITDFTQTKVYECPSGKAEIGVPYGAFRDNSPNAVAVAPAPFVYGNNGVIKFSDVNYPTTWLMGFDTAPAQQFQYTYNAWTPAVDTDADKFPDTGTGIMQYLSLGFDYNGARPRVHRDIPTMVLVDGHAERLDYVAFRGQFVLGGYEPHNYFRDDI